MHWILRLLIKHRDMSALLLTVTLSLWMLASGSTAQARTTRLLTMYLFAPIQVTLNINTGLRNVFAENHRLREQVALLSTRMAVLQESELENERLRGLLDLTGTIAYDLLPVRVLAREPSQRSHGIVVSGGSVDRVERYMPVIDGNGLAGRVAVVMPHISLVQLLTDPLNRTSVMTRASRVSGILESDGFTLVMRHRSSDSVSIGDTIVTSGMGGVYPKGLLVGQVIEQRPDEDPLFIQARIKPFVHFGTIEEAFVMRLSAQWSSFRTELDSLRRMR